MRRVRSIIRRLGWLKISALCLVLADLVLAGVFFGMPQAASYSEIEELRGKPLSFKDLSNYFSDLAYEKGAVYAFEVLKRAPLPPNIDLHLLGHIVGDILYEQKGTEGIYLCTQDFRNACSHTIVIGTLLEKGPESFGEIVETCKKAPGGSGAYAMCFHGLGHGVLAYNDYEMPLAIKMCEKSGESRGREFIECVGGTVMEMIAGVHDIEMWQEKSRKYFKESDPLYPCSADFVPGEAKGVCYTYLTPQLFKTAGADLGYPQPEHFEKAFAYCEPLSGFERQACFGGFGKEFVVLAQNRDIRAIDKMTDDQLSVVLDWCELAKPEDGKNDCVVESIHSLFWGGENDPGAAIRFCHIADKRGLGAPCADSLLGAVRFFIQDKAYREDICSRIPEAYADTCKERLL